MSPDEHRPVEPWNDVPGNDASGQDGPPPTPFDRPVAPAVPPAPSAPLTPGAVPALLGVNPASGRASGPASGRRSGRARIAVLMLVAAAVGFVAGIALAGSVSLPGGLGRDPSAVASERDAGLVALLEVITRTEGEMLAFNESVGERIGDAEDQEAAFAAIADAAAEASDGLTVLRPTVVEQDGHAAIDEVRTAYLPHLDSWIDYLAAIAQRPELLFAEDEQQPYLLLINATAGQFADALQALLATDPAPDVAELAERILDEGFRGMGADAQV